MTVRRIVAVTGVLWFTTTAAAFVASPHGVTVHSLRRLTTTVPATGLNRLDLSIAGGSNGVEVRAASPTDGRGRDAVDVEVFVHGGGALPWISKPSPDLGPVALDASRSGDGLRLGLSGLSGVLPESIKTLWTIYVPVRFAARIAVGSGRVTLLGLEGGLDVDVAVGNIRAKVPNARVGSIDLHSTVGRSSVRLDGEEIRAPWEYGPGSHVRLGGVGAGADAIRLRVTVGDASLVVAR